MESLVFVIVSTLIAGLAMPLGATLACIENIHPRWLENEFRHGVIAFGGGALLSAVALVLVPEGMAHSSLAMTLAMMFAGGAAFAVLDYQLNHHQTPAGQLAAMLSDFLPESIALGAAFASGESSAFLLAGLIALQNLPEGFNAYRELKENTHYSAVKIIGAFVMLALLGPLAGISGHLWLADANTLVAAIMLFAAGGILYSVFQDIAPQVPLKNHWAPPLGAVAGFVLGVAGDYLV
ncbi:ZIP family zinc transporter [Alteromonadaceae bacterium 2753L.S.0a.02]|nr:ZIP family zinc transporter [Alteromonadaceae bacterium 2753L.S.0a.02]